MAPPSWAFQPEYFLSPPDEELICSICSLVFCEPTECPCQHAFCKKCICRWLELQNDCPICRKMVLAQLRPSAPFVRNLISKMKMWCHNKESGCSATFPLESCEHHLKECEFELVECLCGKSMMRRDMQSHNADNCVYNNIVMETDDEKEKNQIERELESLRGKAIGKMAVRFSQPKPSTSSSSSACAAAAAAAPELETNPFLSDMYTPVNWFSRSMRQKTPEGITNFDKLTQAIASRKNLLDRRKRKLELIRNGLMLHSRTSPAMKAMQAAADISAHHPSGSSGISFTPHSLGQQHNPITPIKMIKREPDASATTASSGPSSDLSFPSTSSAFSSGGSSLVGCSLRDFLTTYKSPFLPQKAPSVQSSSPSSFASASMTIAEMVASAIGGSSMNGSDPLPSESSGESSLGAMPRIASVYHSKLSDVQDLGSAPSTSSGARSSCFISRLPPPQHGLSFGKEMSVIRKPKESPDDVCDIVYDSRHDHPTTKSKSSKSLFNSQINSGSTDDIDFWLYRSSPSGDHDEERDHSYAAGQSSASSCSNGDIRTSREQMSASATSESAMDVKSKPPWFEPRELTKVPFASSVTVENPNLFLRSMYNTGSYVHSGSQFPNSSYSNLDVPSIQVFNHLPSTSALGADPTAVSSVLAPSSASSANNMPSQTNGSNAWDCPDMEDDYLSFC